MKQFISKGIVLSRTNYGEADRIITFLTPDQGKVRAIAKGVRKSKSKLAGAIELFSVSELTFIVGRSDIKTLISSRLQKHYGNIVKDLTRTAAAYDAIKLVSKSTEEDPEEGYFDLLKSIFAALDNFELDPALCLLWFEMQLIKLSGHIPNLNTDIEGAKLKDSTSYNFHIEQMQFAPKITDQGLFSANHIKFLRLGFSAKGPQVLGRIQGSKILAADARPLVQTMLQSFVRI
ncbi:DNA repair protein RecO [Candidatus Saccharibacteria bacterium]|nr:DNA repair protein RecO [Candidatus Saccharibacteria bacterium]